MLRFDRILARRRRQNGDAARKSFEMFPQGQRFFSETQRKSYAEGKAKGEAEGEAKGQARAILRVLERRGFRFLPSSANASLHAPMLRCSKAGLIKP
jgi:hypothetical protein